MSLTFLQKLRAVSVARARNDFKSYDHVDAMYFSNALAGETGEVCNLIKKLVRRDHGGPDVGNSIRVEDIDTAKLSEEVGGVLIYLDLLCSKLGIDLEAATTETFNRVSDKLDSIYRL